ncbi:hypothetical protein VU04_05120 [Desulfobulbus sp. TB]|nr:hypothetical protein [Desulfobulbus sp. TB]
MVGSFRPISTVVSEKISALTTKNYLEQRTQRVDRSAFKDILGKVPDRTPLPCDEITKV